MTCEACGWDERDEPVDCCMRCGHDMDDERAPWLCECGHLSRGYRCELCGLPPEDE